MTPYEAGYAAAADAPVINDDLANRLAALLRDDHVLRDTA